MNNLTVVSFHGRHRAEEVLDALEQLNEDWVVDLEDAVAVYRNENGTLRIADSLHPTEGQGADIGGSLGIVIGSLLLAPFTGGLSTGAAAATVAGGAVAGGALGAAAGAGDAEDWREEFGISDEFIDRVGGMVKIGDSAIFALIRSADIVALTRYFEGWGGTIISTTLKPSQAAYAQETLTGR